MTNASRAVKVGDVLTIALGAGVRVVAITAIAERRGSATVARQLYEDRTARAEKPPTGVAVAAAAPAAPIRGPRPDRRARRQGAAMKRGELE